LGWLGLWEVVVFFRIVIHFRLL